MKTIIKYSFAMLFTIGMSANCYTPRYNYNYNRKKVINDALQTRSELQKARKNLVSDNMDPQYKAIFENLFGNLEQMYKTTFDSLDKK